MPYTATRTHIPDVVILEPKVFGDSRGFFFESFNAHDFAQCTGLNVNFVQDNHSRSAKGVLRVLQHQMKQPQRKLVRLQCPVMVVALRLQGKDQAASPFNMAEVYN